MAQPQIPDVFIFARHSNTCRYKDDETWMRCNCRKHLRWTWNGKQYRQSAKTRSRERALIEKKKIEESYLTGEPARTLAKKTIGDCVETFLTLKETEGVTIGVQKKYKRELEGFTKFVAGRNVVLPSQITLDDLIAFRATWTRAYPSSATRQQVQARLKGFLRYVFEAGHIDRIPRLPAIQVDEPETLPLSAEEYEAVLAAVPKAYPENAQQAAKMRALIQLGRHAGLAIEDAATLERGEIVYDGAKKIHRIVTSRQKTGTHVSVPIPPSVSAELLAVLNGNPRFVFWHGDGKPENSAKYWQREFREKLNPHLKLDPAFHFHRLRDTFAVEMLSKGVPMEEVSKLLGHTSIRTTEKSYAKWAKVRQDRLDDLVTATWG